MQSKKHSSSITERFVDDSQRDATLAWAEREFRQHSQDGSDRKDGNESSSD